MGILDFSRVSEDAQLVLHYRLAISARRNSLFVTGPWLAAQSFLFASLLFYLGHYFMSFHLVFCAAHLLGAEWNAKNDTLIIVDTLQFFPVVVGHC